MFSESSTIATHFSRGPCRKLDSVVLATGLYTSAEASSTYAALLYNTGCEAAISGAECPMTTPEELRQLALSLPEVEEHETWGHPTFRVRGKIFATLSADEQVAGVKASLEDQEELIASDPKTFAVASYTGRFGWVSVQLSTVDPGEMRELVIEAWRRTAPRRLVAAYDTQ